MRAERRRHPRAPVLATAALFDGGRGLGEFRVINASAGGLLLEGERPAKEKVGVELRLSRKRVVRTEAAVTRGPTLRLGQAFALSFVNLSPDDEDALQNAVLAVLEEARTASVLIIDGNLEICHALREAIGRMGSLAFGVGTPLEAVNVLEQPNSFQVALIDVGLAGGALGLATGREVLGYMADHHPRLRRVLMAGNVPPWQVELARKALLPYSAHDVLAKPWSDSTLARALGGTAD
jgi:CheY-like chemotaxis protein